MTKTIDPIAAEGARFCEDRVEVEEGVRLRYYRWQPPSEDAASPVFFIAGWISLVNGWKALLQELVRTRSGGVSGNAGEEIGGDIPRG